MENSGLLPGAETYTVILTSLAKARDWESVSKLLFLPLNELKLYQTFPSCKQLAKYFSLGLELNWCF